MSRAEVIGEALKELWRRAELGDPIAAIGVLRKRLSEAKPNEVIEYPDEWINNVPGDIRREVADHNVVAMGDEGQGYRDSFGDEFYHGTRSPTELQDIRTTPNGAAEGVYLAPEAKEADRYASSPVFSGGAIYPVHVRGNIGSRNDMLSAQGASPSERTNAMQDDGLDGYFDEMHGELVTFDPKNIRSRFAAFDPAKKDSTNILASAAPVAAGLGLLGQGEGAEAGVMKLIPEAIESLSRKELQQTSKKVGLPATGSNDILRQQLTAMRKSPNEWTQEDYDLLKPSFAIHQDLRGVDNEAAIFDEGITKGMVDSLDTLDSPRKSFAKGLVGDKAYVMPYDNIQYRSASNPHITQADPLFSISPEAKGQDILEAIQKTARENPKFYGNADPALLGTIAAGGTAALAAPRTAQELSGYSDAVMGGFMQALDYPARGIAAVGRVYDGLMRGEGARAYQNAIDSVRAPSEMTMRGIGERVAESTGSPALGAATYAIPQVFSPGL